jgi:molybdopterin/thiamine biosynthesis adenylyltransferase
MSLLSIPETLRQARRELESVAGYRLEQDWTWFSNLQRWALQFKLSLVLPASSPVPSETHWFVTVSKDYPWGNITVYPSKNGGITETFPHQSLNEEGPQTLPYRTGNLCLGIMTQAWQVRNGLSEPYTVSERLRWHVERTIEWIEKASRTELFLPGDPWEVPARETAVDSWHIGVGSVGGTLPKDDADTYGLVELLQPMANSRLLFAERFFGMSDPALRWLREAGQVPGFAVGQMDWGHQISSSPQAVYGVWIKIATPPTLPHWRLPSTWGELRAWYQEHEGDSLDTRIVEFLQSIGKLANAVSLLLLGYPVPERIGEQPSQIRWESCRLERVSGLRTSLGTPDVKPLRWDSVYGSRDLMNHARGQFDVRMRGVSALLIGAGSLGSTLAELLIRGGLRQLCIVDGETLMLGNLVRHSLELGDVGHPKAAALASRLNASALGAKVTCVPKMLDGQTLSELLESAPDVVIDTTGNDQVLSDLADWNRPSLFLSLSLGLHARRIYAFAARGPHFPVDVFHERIQQWLQRDQEDTKALRQPASEGVGCWSPVFPARIDDVYLLGSATVKWIEETILNPPGEPRLTVFEQENGNQFMGVRRVD